MHFRLSSILLLILTVSVSLAWSVEFATRHERQIVGDWTWPTPDEPNACASFQLLIRADGTFTKFDYTPGESYRLDGVYEFLANGQVRFELKRMQSLGPSKAGELVDLGSLVHENYCRYAIDKDGHLLMMRVRRVSDLDPGLTFESIYARR